MLECTRKWYNYTPQMEIVPKVVKEKKRDRTGVVPIDRRGKFKRVEKLPPNGILLEEKVICKLLKLDIESVMGRSRYDELVNARHLIWYFLYRHEWATQTNLGKRYGVSHSCVSNGLDKVETLKSYEWYRARIKLIRELINRK